MSDCLELRRARVEDMDALCALAAAAFPSSLRWNSLRALGRRRWRAVMDSMGSELWVAVDGAAIAGFAQLVVDHAAWKRASATAYADWALRLLAILLNPAVVVRRVRRFDVAAILPHVEVSSAVPNDQTTWLEVIAVSRQHLRQGVGRVLLNQLESRTRALGLRAIGLRVDTNNEAARSLYTRAGYRLTGKSANGLIYQKVLEQ